MLLKFLGNHNEFFLSLLRAASLLCFFKHLSLTQKISLFMKNHLIALFLLLTISAAGQNSAFQKIDQLLTGLAKEHQFSGSVLVAWK